MGVGIGGNYGTWTPLASPTTTAAPSYTSPYWNNNYPNDMGNSPLGQTLAEQDPQTFYYRYGRSIGVPDDQSAFGRWFAQQYGNFKQGYDAYTFSDPFNASIGNYAAGLGNYNDWLARFNQLAPQLRGLDAASRGGGPARWVAR